MGDSSIQFHKIWIDQCGATEGIRERFGLEDALYYLIGEKLFSFVDAAEEDPDFAEELPAFIDAIRRIFSAVEIAEFLDQLQRTKFLAQLRQTISTTLMIPAKKNSGNLIAVLAAEELLRFARIRQLLQE